jgi:tetratricopeptide (TPR) repeat protein
MMREIDAAYDEIILNRTGNGGSSYRQQSYTYNVPNDLGDIRAKIKSGKIDEAETLLDGVPVSNRSAEWYYLKGTVQHRKGWLEDAARNFEQATRLDPSNAEYRRAFDSINSDRSADSSNTSRIFISIFLAKALFLSTISAAERATFHSLSTTILP